MKTKFLLTFFAVTVFSFGIFAQGILNDGATITVADGTVLTITNSGDYTNENSGSLVLEGDGIGQEGEIIIPGHFLNTSGDVDIDGVITLSGNFTNNDASNNVFISTGTDGTVVFAGSGTQTITSSETDMSNFIDFEAITVNSFSTTELAAGSAATTNGVLMINGGATFTLKTPADESSSGSLITGTTAGDVTTNGLGSPTLNVERFFKVNGRFQYVSIPMSGQTSDLFTEHAASGNYNPNFYTYNEAYNEGTDPTNIEYANYDYPGNGFSFYLAWETVQPAYAGTGLGVPLNVSTGSKTGYASFNEGDLNTVFTTNTPSDLNHNSSYSPLTTFNSNDGNSDYYDGWNLVGNPYTSAIDWDDAGWTKTNINNCLYMWDGDAGNYVYYIGSSGGGSTYQFTSQTLGDATQYIPAMQAFFVKATDAPTFTIPSSARVHNSVIMNKGDENKDEINFDFIKLSAEYNGKTDEMIVRFAEDVDPMFNDVNDAYQVYSTTPEVPQVYSIISSAGLEIPVAINSLPLPEDNDEEIIEVPLGIVAKESGNYIFTAKELKSVNLDKVIFVDVTEDGTYIETVLEEGDEYSCFIPEGEIRGRFYLYFTPGDVTSIYDNEGTGNSAVNVWSNENNIYISISSYDLIDANIEVFDVLGKSVILERLTSTYNIVNVPGSSGTYFVKLRTKDGNIRMDKVFIQK